MARIGLHITDPIQRITIKSMVEIEGHTAVLEQTLPVDLIITEEITQAPELARRVPTLILTHPSTRQQAVAAMRQGVAGYILLPLTPNEVGIMIEKALSHQPSSAVSPENTSFCTLEELEQSYIQKVLRKTRHNHTETARILGIGRNTLWRKLKKKPRSSDDNESRHDL